MQCLPKRNSLTIYFTTYTSITNIRMDMISKIQDGCSLRKLEQISLWSKDIDLILIKIHLELIHQLKVIIILKGRTYICQPLINTAFTLYAFIPPMRSKTTLRYLIHALCTNLNLYPFVFRPQHRNMQTLITIAFGYT